MTWTALIAEYFVVGCHTIIWLFLLSLASGLIDVGKLKDTLDKQPDVVVVMLGVGLAVTTYSLGILLDTVWYKAAEKFLKARNRRLLKRTHSRSPSGEESIGRWFYEAEDRLASADGCGNGCSGGAQDSGSSAR